MPSHTHAYALTYTRKRTHTHAHTHTHVRRHHTHIPHACAFKRTYTRTQVHAKTHTHTHIHAPPPTLSVSVALFLSRARSHSLPPSHMHPHSLVHNLAYSGDTVILPKCWSGRWDITEAIHKVWIVHDHPDIEGASTPIRAVIVPAASFSADSSEELSAQGSSTRKVYEEGPTCVACWASSRATYHVPEQTTTESLHVLQGLFFVTNADGSARRCVAGDTLITPKGWSGHWDIIEPVTTICVATAE